MSKLLRVEYLKYSRTIQKAWGAVAMALFQWPILLWRHDIDGTSLARRLQVAEHPWPAYPLWLFRSLEERMGPLEVMLFAGLAIPAGWADGLAHSPASKVECAKLIEKLPSYARGAARCIVKIDPNAKKPGT